MPSLRLADARFLLGLLLPALTLDTVLRQPAVAPFATLTVWWGIAAVEAIWPALARSPRAEVGASPLTWLLRAHVPLQLVALGVGLHAAAGASWPVVLGIAFSVGFICGAQGITFAHELGHSRRRGDRALAWVLMGSVNYPQFMVEHYRGHHVRAATWDDPASAREGESLWRFLPRTLKGNFVNAWRLERMRLRQHRKSWLASPLAWTTAVDASILLALGLSGRWHALAFWILQSAFAVWLLETVNYLEHYGLARRIGPDGRPEPFGAAHAWNADHVLSNSMVANLQRHSDHHMHAWKRFPELQAMADAPQLPTGYSGCILLAAIPALWFRAMHPRLARQAAMPAPEPSSPTAAA
jgi:alkane 1-monooxygenase